MVFNVKMDNLFKNTDNQYNELTKGGNEDLNIYTFSPINSYDIVKEGGEDGGLFGKKSKGTGLFGFLNKRKEKAEEIKKNVDHAITKCFNHISSLLWLYNL